MGTNESSPQHTSGNTHASHVRKAEAKLLRGAKISYDIANK